VIILVQNGKQDIGLAKRGKDKIMKTISELLEEQGKPMEKQEMSSSQEVTNYSNDTVIELLKQSLNIHWQQTTSLSAQAVHLERWGYTKLANILREDAKEEHEHAMINLKRLEFFDVDYQPLTVAPKTWTRHDMVAMIQYNLNSVREAAAAERATITAARSVGDEMTANTMIPLLKGSEDGIELYEGYLKLIEQMGLDNFLSIQV
jgi:bacterioferritin (cytochrome b1)